MQSHPTNIVIDLRKSLSTERSGTLIRQLGEVQGVNRAWEGKRSHRLLLVDYDPDITSALRILGAIDQQGFRARLIGI